MSDYEVLKEKYVLLLKDMKRIIEIKKENLELKEQMKKTKKELLEANYLISELLKKRK